MVGMATDESPMGAGLRVALITDPEHPGYRPDDVGLSAAFSALGVTAIPRPWGVEIPATEFDVAVIRTPWDYFLHPEAFLAWVDALEVPVLNPAQVLHWNHQKGYLIELEEAGCARLPKTLRLSAGDRAGDTEGLLAELGTDRAVVKPVISGGAHGTRVVTLREPLRWGADEEGDYLAQAFVDTVEETGEWSLIYFGGALSHCVLKTPKSGDFRVQDDFGGTVQFGAAPVGLTEAGARVLEGVHDLLALGAPLAYMRVDLVEEPGTGQPLLMEVELIEPELFFRGEAESPRRFAEAVIAAARAAGVGPPTP